MSRTKQERYKKRNMKYNEVKVINTAFNFQYCVYTSLSLNSLFMEMSKIVSPSKYLKKMFPCSSNTLN